MPKIPDTSVRHWSGQHIAIGDVIWRGAREGDSSSFRIGRVNYFGTRKSYYNDGEITANVEWIANSSSYYWEALIEGWTGDHRERTDEYPLSPGTWGTKASTVSLEGIVKLDLSTVDFGFGNTGEAEFFRVVGALGALSQDLTARREAKFPKPFNSKHEFEHYLFTWTP